VNAQKPSSRRIAYQLRTQIYADSFEPQKRALLDYVDRVPIDEVIVFVPDVGYRTCGLATVDECREHAQLIEGLFAELRRRGVAVSVNFFWTMGFSNVGCQERDRRGWFDFRATVNDRGAVSWNIACPRDRRWLDHMAGLYRIYAALEPRVFWLDDDVHVTLREKVDSACFCDDCIAEMGRRTGRSFDREGLTAAIMADPPNAVRNAWLDLQREIMLTIARTLTDAVHQVSPRTRMGQMLSPPELHWAEGRRFGEYLDALATPETRPVVRPHLGPYCDEPPGGLIYGFNCARLCQFALPDDVEHHPEIENWPSTQYNKSVALTALQIEMACLLGWTGITLSIHPGSGRIDHDRTGMPAMLSRIRPRLSAIAELGLHRDQFRGVGLLWHEDEPRVVRGSAGATNPAALMRSRPWDAILPLLGFATVHRQADVNAVSGEMLELLDENTLRELFSGGVILERRAAESLLRIGKGRWAGLIEIADPAPCVIEIVTDPAFGGIDGEELGAGGSFFATQPPGQFQLDPACREISELRSYANARTGHGIILFENELGGRVAVLPYDGQTAMSPVYFNSFGREAQFDAIIRWLSRGAGPCARVIGAANAVPLLACREDDIILAVLNLGSDPIEPLTVALSGNLTAPLSVEHLDNAGRWQPLEITLCASNGALTLRAPLRVEHLGTAVFRIKPR